MGGSISGYVYNDETGEPIEEAIIKAFFAVESGDSAFRAVTDSNGNYTIGCLALGTYTVSAKAPGFIEQWYNHAYSDTDATYVKVEANNINITDIDFSLSPRNGSISGYVFDVNEHPIDGARVTVEGHLLNGEWFWDRTDTRSDGSYIITDIPPGNYYIVRARKSGFAFEWFKSKITENSADHVSVTEGNNTSGINFYLDIAGSITGHVYDEENRIPISWVVCCNARLKTGEFVGFNCTNYDGSYTIWLRTGQYLIIARGGEKYVPEWYNDSYDMGSSTIVNVTAPHETCGIDFYLAKAGSISGHIYSFDGQPISDASIYAFSDRFPGNGANSQSDGSYIIEGLPSGNYSVQVAVSGYFPDSNDGVVVNAPDDTPGVNFTLKKMPDHFIIEEFETGDFSKLRWRHYGDANWTITSSQKNSGTYSAQAGSIGDNESTSLEITLDCVSGDITFYLKVSSESSFDKLEFYINGVEQNWWSGDQDWARVSFPITAGTKTFTLTYRKDGSEFRGDDTAWIDDIVFPVPP